MTVNADILRECYTLPYLKLLQASAGAARMVQNVDDKTDRGEEFAKWVIRNVKSLATMLTEEEKKLFYTEIANYTEEKRKTMGVVPKPKYRVVGRKLIERNS